MKHVLFVSVFSKSFRSEKIQPKTARGFIKPTARTISILLMLAMICGPSTTSAASFSTLTQQLGWFYKPPSDGNLDTLSKNFNNYILTRGDEKTRDSLKAKGVTTHILQYLRFDAVEDPGSCTKQPNRNQVADRPGDFCWMLKYHPDWFLRDKYGSLIRADKYDTIYYLMDPGHSGWRSFWLERAKIGQETYGWFGVMLDNVEASLVKRSQIDDMPVKYTSTSSYQSAIKGFLSYIWNSYFLPKGRPLMANIVSVADYSVWHSYLTYMTGGMCEGWAVDWSSGWRTVSDWENHLKFAETSQANGKRLLLVAQGYKTNYSRQQFAYASYLLIANGKAAFRYAKNTNYREAWLYSNYSKSLGSPKGARYYKTGVWYRDFSNGRVWVNPSSHTSGITTYTN